MEQPQIDPTTPSAAEFASLLSSLMSPDAGAAREPEWDEDGLAEDVTTLSYESALRSHERYGSKRQVQKTAPEDRLLQAAQDIEAIRAKMTSGRYAAGAAALEGQSPARKPLVPLSVYDPMSNVDFDQPEPAFEAAPRFASAPQPERRKTFTPFQRNLKKSSITIRMSEEECAQLHQRAAEAGVTVSAYLRSCTFEAEALRAQVKEVLSQLTASVEEKSAVDPGSKKPVSSVSEQAEAAASSATGFGWLKRLMPQGRTHSHAMRA